MRKILSVILYIFKKNKKVSYFILWPIAKRILGPGYSEVVSYGDGIKIRVFSDMADMVNKALLFYSSYNSYPWEPATSRVFREIIQGKKNIVIAGGHIGYYALLASTCVPQSQVYVFEPVKKIYNRLQENIRMNAFSNIRCEPYALSDATGVAKIKK